MTKNSISSDGLSIHDEANLTTDKVRLSDIKLFIDMKRTQLDDRQKSDPLEYAKRCKIYNTLKLGCGVGVVITVRQLLFVCRSPGCSVSLSGILFLQQRHAAAAK